YDEDTTGIPDEAIIEAAARFRRGMVKGQSDTFAPSIAKFCTEARRVAELLQYRDRPALPAASVVPYRSGRLAPFQILAEQMRQKYAGRPILAVGLSHDQWLARRREFPLGHTWIAALNGTVFGPMAAEIEQEDAA